MELPATIWNWHAFPNTAAGWSAYGGLVNFLNISKLGEAKIVGLSSNSFTIGLTLRPPINPMAWEDALGFITNILARVEELPSD